MDAEGERHGGRHAGVVVVWHLRRRHVSRAFTRKHCNPSTPVRAAQRARHWRRTRPPVSWELAMDALCCIVWRMLPAGKGTEGFPRTRRHQGLNQHRTKRECSKRRQHETWIFPARGRLHLWAGGVSNDGHSSRFGRGRSCAAVQRGSAARQCARVRMCACVRTRVRGCACARVRTISPCAKSWRLAGSAGSSTLSLLTGTAPGGMWVGGGGGRHAHGTA